MIYLVLLLFFAGVLLSAFFSGSETGFYRASRMRFLMDGLDGDRVSKRMLWLFNNPALFVATSLVGNNLANYLVSLAVVLGTGLFFASSATSAEIIAPIALIALSPVLFVYGELLPKSIYFMAPNRILRRSAPLFFFFTLLFAPIAAVLWSLARLLEKLLGQSPEKVRFMLARRELQDVLQEGQEAGILHPSQRLLGQNFFVEASNPVSMYCSPLSRVMSLPLKASTAEILQFAQRNRLLEVPLYESKKSNLVSYVRTIDLLIADKDAPPGSESRPLNRIRGSELYAEALLQMQTSRVTTLLVVDDRQRPIGLLSIDQLTDPLLTGSLASLRR